MTEIEIEAAAEAAWKQAGIECWLDKNGRPALCEYYDPETGIVDFKRDGITPGTLPVKQPPEGGKLATFADYKIADPDDYAWWIEIARAALEAVEKMRAVHAP